MKPNNVVQWIDGLKCLRCKYANKMIYEEKESKESNKVEKFYICPECGCRTKLER